jgi:CDP-diacylglycerol--serine O-phosphatidyltransferase
MTLRQAAPGRRLRRGAYLVPSSITLANLFCGYACVVHAMRSEFESAAVFIGIAIVLDMLDGAVARVTNTASAFGREFDSLADVISFGLAPAILSFAWGLWPLGRLGWAAGFVFVTAAAIRLARFNVQTLADRRFFVGMPSPAAAGVIAATVFYFPSGPADTRDAAPVLAMMLAPAALMVSTIRYRSFKSVDFNARRSPVNLLGMAVLIAAIVARPHEVLIVMAYVYLASGIISSIVGRLRRRGPEPRPLESSASPSH